MTGKRRWWQYNPDKVRANVEEARTFFGAALHGSRGRAMRPYHPDHYPADDYPDGGPAQGDSRFCTICGTANAAIANFCSRCGGRL